MTAIPAGWILIWDSASGSATKSCGSCGSTRGKYGRYLAEIWIEQNGVWSNVNDALVTAGHAVYQEY